MRPGNRQRSGNAGPERHGFVSKLWICFKSGVSKLGLIACFCINCDLKIVFLFLSGWGGMQNQD